MKAQGRPMRAIAEAGRAKCPAFEAIARSLAVRLRARAGEEGKERQPWFAVGFF
jgi:hypothetical protein